MKPSPTSAENTLEEPGRVQSGKARSWWRAAVPLIVCLVIVLIPHPAGLEINAWRYFALFAAVVVALILEPIPAAAAGLVGVTAAAASRYVVSSPADSITWALGGFSDSTVWLIFGAFMFALGNEKTGLGRRIALLLVKSLGRRTLGLGYAIALADLVLAPFTPSNTARSGGTIFPIIRNIPALYGSQPGKTARRIGSYIMWTAFAATCVTSSMFLTALAPNILALSLIKETVEISWTQWAIGFLPVGVILILLLPVLVYKIYPPEVTSNEKIPSWASRELDRLGKFSDEGDGDGPAGPGRLGFVDFRRANPPCDDGDTRRDQPHGHLGHRQVGRNPGLQAGLECPGLVCDARDIGRRPEQGGVCHLVR